MVNISKGVQLANVICQKFDVGSRNAGYFVEQDDISKNDLFPGNAVFFQGDNPWVASTVVVIEQKSR